MVRVAIHQANFFPHKAFFDKMSSVDVFVIMGWCQYEKNGYQNRFKYNGQWNTMSVNRGLEPIMHKTYVNPQEDFARIVKRIPTLERFTDLIHESLYLTNTRIILKIAETIGLTTPIEHDHQTHLTATERLVDICKHYKADVYLSGPSGRKYLDESLFTMAGIKVEYQESKPSQPIIDLL